MSVKYLYSFKNYNIKVNYFKKKIILKKKFNYFFLLTKPSTLIPFKLKKNIYMNSQKIFSLNFKRNRFFPTLRTLSNENYLFLSLGMFLKFFQKTKAFLRSKTMYLLASSFIRKILLFSSLKNLILTISRVPVFLKEILSTINDPVTNLYKNPFNENLVFEKNNINPFKFSTIIFLNNKEFGQMKLKKKGRLKRKISKRITLVNRIID